MPTCKLFLRAAVLSACLAVLGATTGCGEEADGSALPLGASTLELRSPPTAEPLTRAPARFDHGKHTTALQTEGCPACHQTDSSGALRLSLVELPVGAKRGSWMDAYHAQCLGCHQRRARQHLRTGPFGCGDCHLAVAPTAHSGAPLRFDLSLHQRHVATPGYQCSTCHHVLDEPSGKLVYRKDTEEACGACHDEKDEGRRPSLRHAAHTSCVGCHLARARDNEKAGPVLCAGCHDRESVGAMVRLADPPRLLRGQADRSWLSVGKDTTAAVAFDHAAHEGAAHLCSDCHHRSLERCERCHTAEGSTEGKGVTLLQAYHQARSPHSCVGCHASRAASKECAGCHSSAPRSPPASSCARCHAGPAGGGEALDLPPPPLVPPVLEPLPASGESFPDQVTIDTLAAEYGQASLPHRTIVARLDQVVRAGSLAAWFHGRQGTLCAGCHHHTPVGSRPPACPTCHAREPSSSGDRPRLEEAYHRQCLGCHQRMQTGPLGCTDCHARANAEVKR
jgi:hypothetical protein